MKFKTAILGKLRDQQGAILVIVAILFSFIFLGLLAFAIDIGHITVVKNELQNAADAGALAGALNLYYDEQMVLSEGLSEDLIGTVNPGANQVAYDTATQNKSDQVAVEIEMSSSDPNADDVQRGHWNPETRTFTPHDSLLGVSLVTHTTEELNAMDGSDGSDPFINAVRVKTWRGNTSVPDATPVTAFFAQIFGIDSFTSGAEATAWLGYASGIAKNEADLPLALCLETVTTEGQFPNCNIGRRINSSTALDSSNTGGWTDFSQVSDIYEECKDQCTLGGASTSTVREIYRCDGSINPSQITFGCPMAAIGGEIATVYADILDCWENNYKGPPGESWHVLLPVIVCESSNVDTCPVVTNAIEVDIVFVSSGGTAKPADAPTSMDGWEWDGSNPDIYNKCDPYKAQVQSPAKSVADAIAAIAALQDIDTIYSGVSDPVAVAGDRWQGQSNYTSDIARWDCFTDYFQLKNADNSYAPLDKKSIYFKPDCSPTKTAGGTGGTNFGILAKRPVLVE